MPARITEPMHSMTQGRIGCALVACLAVLMLGACSRTPRDLSTGQLSQVVGAKQASLKSCFDAALKTHPYDHEVRMQATIHIAADGRVSSVELGGEGGLPGMSACIRDSIKGWKFPPANDPTDTSLPLIFKRDPPKDGPNSEAAKEMIRRALGQTSAPR